MNSLINIFADLTGITALLNKVNGLKTYIAGAIALLTGVSIITSALAGMGSEILALHGAAMYLTFIKGVSADPNLALLAKGAAEFSAGLGMIGLRHAIAKIAPPVTTTT